MEHVTQPRDGKKPSAYLESIGIIFGQGHPSVFWHPKKDIKTLVHGDDYVSAGDETSMNWLQQELSKPMRFRRKSWALARVVNNKERF